MIPLDFDVTIEIPGGSRNKYEMDHVTGRIRLDRMLFTSTRTRTTTASSRTPSARTATPRRARDDCRADVPRRPDPLPHGRHVPHDRRGRRRRQGPLRARRRPALEHLRDIHHVAEFDRLEIQHFFEVYKDLEPGKSVEGATWTGRTEAEAEIHASWKRFDEAGGHH